MGKSKSRTASSNDDQSDMDIMALKLVELLTEEHVLTKLKRALYPQEISDKIYGLNNQIINLTGLLKKEERIALLETKMQKMEEKIYHQEQYSRRPNMRIHGVHEHDNKDTTTIVMDVINSKMSFKPPLESSQLERSHRVGPKLDQQDRVRSRPIIVRFKSENTRDAVQKARFRLKEHNERHRDARIYINDDLTVRRATLARECRATLARECRATLARECRATLARECRATLARECRATLARECRATLARECRATLARECRATLARECRATLARECRALKRTGKLNDCWTTSGNVMVKDNQNKIRQIRSAADIQYIK